MRWPTLATREPTLIAAVARETTHPDPERRRRAQETMGYPAVVNQMLDSFAAQGVAAASRSSGTRTPTSSSTLSAGTLVRAAGTLPRDRLKAEIASTLDLFVGGAVSGTVGRPASLRVSDNLCYRDAYARQVDATVTAVDAEAGEVLLDRTVFYPGGGGQPADIGTLRSGSDTWTVTGARKRGDDIWHVVEGAPPPVGALSARTLIGSGATP